MALTVWQLNTGELIKFLTALGDSKWLLPAAGVLAVLLVSQRHSRFAISWLGALAVAAFTVLVSKVAFLGFGIGIRDIDFTGFSGHAAMSAAIFPVAGYLLGSHTKPRIRLLLFALGVALAILIALSRVWINAHSVSEIVLGSGLGLGASLITVSLARAQLGIRTSLVALAFVVPALLVTNTLPNHNTHALVLKIALSLSGRSQPFDRERWIRTRAPAANARLNLQQLHYQHHPITPFQPPDAVTPLQTA